MLKNFQLYPSKKKLQSMIEMIMSASPTLILIFIYSASPLSPQSMGRHVALLTHYQDSQPTNLCSYFLILSQHRSSLYQFYCLCFDPIYCTKREHVNHYTTDAVHTDMFLMQLFKSCFILISTLYLFHRVSAWSVRSLPFKTICSQILTPCDMMAFVFISDLSLFDFY